MRPEMKSSRNEVSTRHKINSVDITFHYGRNKMNFFSGVVRDKRPNDDQVIDSDINS